MDGQMKGRIDRQTWKFLGSYVSKGPFNIYVNKQRWVGGWLNVYAYKVNTLFLFTVFVYQG